MAGSAPLIARAHAKINLALAVGPPRDGDGLHPIASWMTRISLHDTLTITRLPESRASRYAVVPGAEAPRKITVDWPVMSDLAVRAHRALETEVGRSLPVQLLVEKRIPAGAGLGGGSSDAAKALLGVRELFGLDISDTRLAEIALGLGADVPFFLGEAPAFVGGVGERIERTTPVSLAGRRGEPVYMLLIVPEFGCPTGAVYKAFDEIGAERFEANAAGLPEAARKGVVTPSELFNDLAPAAEHVAAGLSEIRRAASEATGAAAHVTGSGSAVFLIDKEGAEGLESRARRLRHALKVMGAVVEGVHTV